MNKAAERVPFSSLLLGQKQNVNGALKHMWPNFPF